MTTSRHRWRTGLPRPHTATATLAIGLALASVFTIPAMPSAAYFTDEKVLDANSVSVWSMHAPTVTYLRRETFHMFVEVVGPFSEDWAKIAGIGPNDLGIASPDCGGDLYFKWHVSSDGSFYTVLDLVPIQVDTTCEFQFTYKQWKSPITTMTAGS